MTDHADPVPFPFPGTCSMVEVRRVLAQARAVARRAAAARPSTLPPGSSRGSRPEAVVGAGRVFSSRGA